MPRKDLFHETYLVFFDTTFGRLAIEQFQLKLIVFNPEREVITTWIQ